MRVRGWLWGGHGQGSLKKWNQRAVYAEGFVTRSWLVGLWR